MTTPAPPPGPVTLKGRYGTSGAARRLRACCGPVAAFAGHDHMWTYISRHGPFADAAAFSAWLGERAASQRPLCVRDRRHRRPRASGSWRCCRSCRRCASSRWAHCLLAGAAAHAARHRNPIPVGALRLRDSGLPALRVEMRRSQRALRAAPLCASGSSIEGMFRQHMITKGRNRDNGLVLHARQRVAARKRNFERWLAPENFDSEGRQRTESRGIERTKA